MTLLQIRSAPIIPWLPNPVILLFSRPAGGLLARFSQPHVMGGNDEHNYAALKSRKSKSSNETDTHVNIQGFSMWREGTIDAWSDDNKAWITGPQRVMILDQSDKGRAHHNQNQVKHSSHPHICKGLLQKWGMKRQQTTVKRHAKWTYRKIWQAHNNEQLNKIETERKDSEPKIIELAENMDTVCKERLAFFIANKALNKKLCTYAENH